MIEIFFENDETDSLDYAHFAKEGCTLFCQHNAVSQQAKTNRTSCPTLYQPHFTRACQEITPKQAEGENK